MLPDISMCITQILIECDWILWEAPPSRGERPLPTGSFSSGQLEQSLSSNSEESCSITAAADGECALTDAVILLDDADTFMRTMWFQVRVSGLCWDQNDALPVDLSVGLLNLDWPGYVYFIISVDTLLSSAIQPCLSSRMCCFKLLKQVFGWRFGDLCSLAASVFTQKRRNL